MHSWKSCSHKLWVIKTNKETNKNTLLPGLAYLLINYWSTRCKWPPKQNGLLT